ncbi:MAG: NAD-dependent deacetylase [Nocardioidaceae bacterium]|nr:NAD-dependent deacetylase [Nocardioidaceae bacterium]
MQAAPPRTTVDEALDLLAGRRWLVLTGAGVSTDSGIPDYRGPGAPARTPMTGQQFRSGSPARQRYWARAYLGWSTMGAVTPNTTHRLLASLEEQDVVAGLITQNVDGLHTSAGQRDVVDLHGRLDRVICLSCGDLSSRAVVQDRLARLNPGFRAEDVEVLPDGDVALESTAGFVLADCIACGGALKPDVVFFGENVPVPTVEHCYRMVEEAEAMVVLGSSLHVFSGRRFVKKAHASGVPVVIVNRGETRGDAFADVKIDGGCAETLTLLAGALG